MVNKEALMQICCNIARQNLGRTGRNPSVGALIWNENRTATGITGFGGIPHAETVAIEKAQALGIDCRNSTLFVTLEPCSHFGRTPPCVDTIIEAKIPHVIIGMKDPDPRVNGAGIQKLTNAGTTVEMLNLNEVKELYHPYNIFKHEKRPYICLKIASSMDGKIAIASGESKWITSQEARRYTNFLRSRFNGILIGSNTYREDSPTLTCRIEGLENFSPKKFVASSNEIDGFVSVKGSIEEIITQIYTNDVQSVLVEGGANLITQFIKADAFDEVMLVQAPMFFGNDAKPCIENLQFSHIPLQVLKIVESTVIGGNIFTRLVREQSATNS